MAGEVTEPHRGAWLRMAANQPTYYLAVGGLAVAILVCIAALAIAAFDRKRTIETAGALSATLASTLSQQARQSIAAVDQALIGLVNSIEAAQLDDPSQIVTIHEKLAERAQSAYGVFAFFILDSKGRLLNSSRTPKRELIDFSDRPAFIAQRDRPGWGLYISPPVIGRVGYAKDKWTVNLSRSILRPNGQFAGIVAASVPLETLEQLHEHLELETPAKIAIFRYDGTLMAVVPREDEALGRSFVDSAVLQSKAGVVAGDYFEMPGPIKGTERIGALRRVPDNDLLVYVGLNKNAVLAPWRARAMQIAALAAVAVLALILATLWLRRAVMERETAQRYLAERMRILAEVTVELSSVRSKRELHTQAAQKARALIGSHYALVSTDTSRVFSEETRGISLTARYAQWQDRTKPQDDEPICRIVCCHNRPLRLTRNEQRTDAKWKTFGTATGARPPLHGILAVPINSIADGRNLGFLLLSDRLYGDFTSEDEAVAAQLARIVSITLENLDLLERTLNAEQRLADFVESSSDWVWETDGQHRFTYFSPHGREIIGLPSERIIGKTRWELAQAGSSDTKWAEHRLWLEQHRPFRDFIYNFEVDSERQRYFAVSGKPIFNEQNQFLGYRGTAREITDRVEAEAVAQRIAERYRQIVETAREGIAVTGTDRKLVYANKRLAEILGHNDLGTLIGADVRKYVHPDDQGELEREWAQRNDGHGNQYELRLVKADGSTVWALVNGQPIHDESGCFQGTLAMITDITEKVAMDERLAQAQKMEAVGQLTGGIAHDFNNLLTVIIGNAELLSETSPDKQSKELAAVIKLAADRGAELTQRLLAFSRRQPLQPHRLDLGELIDKILGLLTRILGEHYEICVEPKAGLWPVNADPGQLESALMNLVVNARDAMPRGGRLIIETTNIELGEEYASTHSEVTPGDYVQITVTDTGEGMSQEVQERAFEPFFTTKDIGRGSGLGLSMVYGFVKQSGGHIKIYSEIGQGTSVKIYLPRARENSTAETLAAAARAIEAPGEGERILLVEDDALVRQHVTRLLADLGYQVKAAANGQSALAILAESSDFDLLLTDVVMPGGMNGRELAKRALNLYPNLKVLYASGYTENAIIHHGRLDPGVLLLSKPFRRKDLMLKVRQALET